MRGSKTGSSGCHCAPVHRDFHGEKEVLKRSSYINHNGVSNVERDCHSAAQALVTREGAQSARNTLNILSAPSNRRHKYSQSQYHLRGKRELPKKYLTPHEKLSWHHRHCDSAKTWGLTEPSQHAVFHLKLKICLQVLVLIQICRFRGLNESHYWIRHCFWTYLENWEDWTEGSPTQLISITSRTVPTAFWKLDVKLQQTTYFDLHLDHSWSFNDCSIIPCKTSCIFGTYVPKKWQEHWFSNFIDWSTRLV